MAEVKIEEPQGGAKITLRDGALDVPDNPIIGLMVPIRAR